MRLLAAAILMAAALAGCSSPDPGGHDDGFEPVFGGEAAPWGLQLCDQGYRVVQRANASWSAPSDRSCDFRVTKPLADPGSFDWQSQHGPGNEVSLAVNPTDPLNLAGGAKDYTVSYISDVAQCGQYTVWNGHFRSLDGGRTWDNDLIPGFPGDPRPSPLKGNECNTDPVSVFDGDGTYWHNGLNYRGAREDVGDPDNPLGSDGLLTGSQIFFARSPASEKAATFDRITFASYGDNEPTIFNDKNWLAVDPASDHMIHTWTNFYAFGALIMYVESFDGGATWTHPAPIPPNAVLSGGAAAVTAPRGQFSMPQYDSSGDVWVIWSTSGGPAILHGQRNGAQQPTVFSGAAPTVQYGGGLGGAGCLAATDFRASVYPVLAIDTSGGVHNDRKYIAYPAAGVTGAGIWFTRSDDGVAWDLPVEITASLDDDQFMSWIDVGPDGTVHVTYYDCAIDAGGRNMTVGYTYSSDGGDTWAGPFWVAQAAFDGDLGHHQSGGPFIGDYIAVDASETGVHFFWADTRHGRSDVYAATLVKSWDNASLYAPELRGDP